MDSASIVPSRTRVDVGGLQKVLLRAVATKRTGGAGERWNPRMIVGIAVFLALEIGR